MFVVDPTNITTTVLREEFEDTKGVYRIRISKKKQTTQLPTEKVQKHKQRSTKHTHKTKDRVTRTTIKTGANSGAPEGIHLVLH
jgi:hypothetical protein